MKLKAYVLAADPNWIEDSVLSYYDMVEEIVVSYDSSGTGWSGKPIPVEECLRRLRGVDKSKKMRFLGGNYYNPKITPLENDTYQRQEALAAIGDSADWIVTLDTDEVMPNPRAFMDILKKVPADRLLVQWPMRVFFQRTAGGRFLEVTTFLRQQMTEYPGPAATRPGIRLEAARHAFKLSSWVVDIRPKTFNPETQSYYYANSVIPNRDAIYHFSWVRSDADIARKVAGWGHSTDFDGKTFLNTVWRKAPWKWPFLYNLHPIYPKRWQALWPVKLNMKLSGP